MRKEPSSYRLERAAMRGCRYAASARRHLPSARAGHVRVRPFNLIVRRRRF
jgi:hypothetical protein